jgi:hypothetical protein
MPHLPELLATAAALFPDRYATADTAWTTAAARLRLAVDSSAEDGALRGPEGEPLTTRWAWLGDSNARQVLVLMAGVHGAEGPLGSAVQLDLLQAAAHSGWTPPPDHALLLVHAINPWGYAWTRRCDAAGVDLNRNAIDFSRPPPANHDYQLVTAALRDPDHDRRHQALAVAREELGDRRYEIAVSGGQYEDPTGPFYGGRAPAHGHRVCSGLIGDFDLHRRSVVVLDIHSGLGPWAHAELICDHPPGGPHFRDACRRFGDALNIPAHGTSASVPKSGLLDYLWQDALGAGSCYLTVECGTRSTDALFAVLASDHALWAEGQPTPARRLEQAAAMAAHFVPADPYWRAPVLAQARLFIHQTIGDAPWR